MKRLYFGPWCGELGWEVMWAIPVVRKIARDFDHTTVCGPEGHGCLWDFAHEYIGVATDGGTCYHRGELLEAPPVPPKGAVVVTPDVLWKRFGRRERAWLAGKGQSPAPKEWRQHNPPPAMFYQTDVMLALRGPKEGAPWKEWPRESADVLAAALSARYPRVTAIGGMDNYRPESVGDFRGAPIDALCTRMHGAIVVGPSSGPLHMAALCGASRIVTWFAGPDCMRSRYETQWNPFGVPVAYICSGRQPSPAEVLAWL